ncbi:Golgi transport complex subunit 6 [Batrachochytrium dendrobatidis]
MTLPLGAGGDTPTAGFFQNAEELQPQNKLSTGYPLYRKLTKVLHLSLDEPETQEALSALSDIYPQNTPSARRNLKSHVEKQVSGVSKEFLAAFDALHSQLIGIESHIDSIGNRCEQMDIQLKAAYKNAASVLKHTQDMKTKSEQASYRKVVVDALLERFTLSDTEIRLLATSSETVNTAFFAALSRVQNIQTDCQTLLIGENQRLGLEIMETTNMYQESAFEKLFRWALAECRLLKSESPEITVELKKGIQTLKQRPILFESCMEEVSNIRRATNIRSFQNALSVGGPGGFPRPIEVHAHDVLRYTGDILAWVHQAAVSEREMLEGLFDLASIASRERQMPTTNASDQSALREIKGYQADDELLLRVLEKNLEGVCRPLKSRIVSVLQSGLGPITSYRIANLVQFYSHTIIKVIGSSSEISALFDELIQDAFKIFFSALMAQAADMLRFVDAPSFDLQPPQIVKDTISQLREIMLSHDESLLSSSGQEGDFRQIVNTLLEPVLKLCEIGSASLKPLESAMYMVNCLCYIQMALSSFSFAATQIKEIQDQIDSQIHVLVQEQYSVILSQSGLENLVMHMETLQPPLAHTRTVDAKAVAEAIAKLDLFLVTVTVDVAETLSRISSVQIARRVSQRGFRKFVDTYRNIVAKIMDPINKYEFPSSLIVRSVEEVETLLSLQDSSS